MDRCFVIKKILIAVLCVFSLLLLDFSPVYANYAQVFSFKELASEFEKLNEQTLVVFDVDEVLITKEDQVFHKNADKIVMPLLDQARQKAITQEEKKDLENAYSLGLVLPKSVLIEKEIPSFIKNLQQKHVKVIALTALPSGTIGVVPKIERWRIDHLKSVNIDFSLSFPKVERHSFNEITKPGKSAPLYEEGVLFSGGYTKGEVLKAFLKWRKFNPSKIVFIDDVPQNLDSVKAELQSLNENIDFRGYQYTGAKRFYKEPDEFVIKYQFDYLRQNKKWLNDAETEQCLSKNNLKNNLKILILGGTRFLGIHLTEEFQKQGHEVTLFNRGIHNLDLFSDVEKLRGDRDSDLQALLGRHWDAVIGYSFNFVQLVA